MRNPSSMMLRTQVSFVSRRQTDWNRESRPPTKTSPWSLRGAGKNPFCQTWECQVEEQMTLDEIGQAVILNRPARLVIWRELVCARDVTSCSP
jgi:hypothetical protein